MVFKVKFSEITPLQHSFLDQKIFRDLSRLRINFISAIIIIFIIAYWLAVSLYNREIKPQYSKRAFCWTISRSYWRGCCLWRFSVSNCSASTSQISTSSDFCNNECFVFWWCSGLCAIRIFFFVWLQHFVLLHAAYLLYLSSDWQNVLFFLPRMHWKV